jgi:hypothetical protein
VSHVSFAIITDVPDVATRFRAAFTVVTSYHRRFFSRHKTPAKKQPA